MDTVTIEKPVPVEVTKTETEYIKVPVSVKDTVINESIRYVFVNGEPNIELSRVSKRYYEPLLYDIYISGVDPSLDSCSILKETINKETIYKKKNQFNAYIETNYIFTKDHLLDFQAGLEFEHSKGFSIKAGYFASFSPRIMDSGQYGPFIGLKYKIPIVKGF